MTSSLKIAVLFASKRSIYKEFPFIDVYDQERDARTYNGDLPLIAHPPCQLWGNLAYVNYARWGGEHNKPGNDGGLFEFALNNVNMFGGVLEHPKSTHAWEVFGLTKPYRNTWTQSGKGWTCEVWQSAYGHKANKATWLYYVSPPNNLQHGAPYDLNWSRPIADYQIGYRDQRGKNRNKPTLSHEEANATPRAFALALINLVLPIKPLGDSMIDETVTPYGLL